MTNAFYRRYRPKTFADVIGQETIVTILQNAARAGRIGHAYIFSGGRGSGKTTTARILAKTANCAKRRDDKKFYEKAEPCNACSNCQEIDSGNSPDVIEIDAASNRGIEEIRNLKETLQATPMKSARKIFIIDEAHMLTGAAFNALLKTMEEPPEYGILILATTEYEKIPATISSRAQRFFFQSPAISSIIAKLKKITAAEKISAEPEALEIIARAAGASMRDAESLLDQIHAFAKEITVETVQEITGRAGLKKNHEFLEKLLRGDAAGCLEQLAQMGESAAHIQQFTKDLIHYSRKLLSLSVDPSLEKMISRELTDHELEEMKKLIPIANPQTLVDLIRSFIQAYSQMRYSPHGSIPLEIAVIEHLEKKSKK